MNRFFRLLSIFLVLSSCSFIKAHSDKKAPSNHPAREFEEEPPKIPNITVNIQMPAADIQQTTTDVQDGLYGPTKEKTIRKMGLLSPQMLRTCYNSAPQKIKDLITALQNRRLATQINIPTAILLYGPHGTGKTTLAQVLAQMSNPIMDCWIIHAGGLLNSYKDGSEESLRASLAPLDKIGNEQCVVLIDEIDVLTDNHSSINNANDATATTISGILDKIKGKKNILLVLATNNLDKIPKMVSNRLEYKYFKIDMPGEEQRKAAIDYWFNALEETVFKCESSPFIGNVFNEKSQEENNEDFKYDLSKKTAGWFLFGGASYRDIQDLFTMARESAFLRAVKNRVSVVTITNQDFETAFEYIKIKKKELEITLWGNIKKFYKDNPTLAASISGVFATTIVSLIHHYWEYLPQLRLQTTRTAI